MYKHPLIDRDKMTPQEALDILIDGNHRFANNLTANKDLHNLVMMTKDKQHPFVSMLSCSDSRAPVEMVFDQALAVLAPDTGLLRNTARQNPATNVYVQLGVFDAAGLFTPLDLRQTFKLTPAMWRDSSTLMLGARYVAARAVTRQNPNQRTATASGAAVTPGQVQVQLPFLMKVH